MNKQKVFPYVSSVGVRTTYIVSLFCFVCNNCLCLVSFVSSPLLKGLNLFEFLRDQSSSIKAFVLSLHHFSRYKYKSTLFYFQQNKNTKVHEHIHMYERVSVYIHNS